MRFVPVQSEDKQALLMTHKARKFLVRRQTQIVNAMRAHLGEFSIVVPKGIHNVERLIRACEQAGLPAPARKALSLPADQLVDTQRKIEHLTADIRANAKVNEDAQRLQTIPGIGPITASALVSALPDIADFQSGRDRPGQPHGVHRLCADEEQDRMPRGASRLTKTGASPHREGKCIVR